jgi:hypothetical protein
LSLSIGFLLTHLVSCNCRIEAGFKGGISHMIGRIGIEQKREKDVTHYVTILQKGMFMIPLYHGGSPFPIQTLSIRLKKFGRFF